MTDHDRGHLARRWLDAPPIDGLRFRRIRRRRRRLRGDRRGRSLRPTGTTASRGCRPRATCARRSKASAGIDPDGRHRPRRDRRRAVAESGVERVMRDGVAVYELWGHVRPGGPPARAGHGAARARTCAAPRSGQPRSRPGRPPSCVGGGAGDRGRPSRAPRGARVRADPLVLRHAPADPGRHPGRSPAGRPRAPTGRPRTSIGRSSTPSARRSATTGAAREQTDEDFTLIFERAELDTDLWVVAWDGDEIAGVVQTWIWPEENVTLGVAARLARAHQRSPAVAAARPGPGHHRRSAAPRARRPA